MAKPSVTELDVVHEHLRRYRKVTLQTLERVPAERFDWRPSPGAMSFAEQFAHIAETEEHYMSGLVDGTWSPRPFRPGAAPADAAALRALLDATRAATLERLARIDAHALERVPEVPGIPVQWPLRSWLWYVVEHEVHHKAQLASHLRTIDVEAPFFAFALPPGVRPDLAGS